ncbi:MAG: DUF3237 domain-containing protein [Phenylobacterium sp.]|nr:DUF3237 domain-containing protein [Phenylobacterium sp.]
MSDFDFGDRSLVGRPLCCARFEVDGGIMDMGASPWTTRRIGYITGGRFEGPRLKGDILPGGGNWSTAGVGDGGAAVGTFDARCVWRTDDGALIYMTYTGRTWVPPDVGAAFRDPAQPEVDPGRYRLRIAPVFETSDPRYAWLNAVLAVGVGERLTGGVRHFIYEMP